MAIRQCFIFNHHLLHPSHHLISKPNYITQNYPSNLHKISILPLRHQKPSVALISCASATSTETPPEGYRRNVGICLINSSKMIFAASRLGMTNAWQMPQGGVDEGEDPRSAVIRELREETGVSSAEIIAEVPYWLTYDFPPHVREKLNREWGSDWKGQTQKWFLLKFTGPEEEIDLLGDGTEKAEFGEWTWLSQEQIVELAANSKKFVYKEVLSVFCSHLQ